MFNELSLYTLCVFYLLFTDYESTYEAKWIIGFMVIIVICLNFLINIIIILVKAIIFLKDYIRKKRMMKNI
jgi:hypothetical protein